MCTFFKTDRESEMFFFGTLVIMFTFMDDPENALIEIIGCQDKYRVYVIGKPCNMKNIQS